jgi:ankyrin repeat protein
LKNAEIVTLLLDNNVDVEVKTNKGATPLYLVCQHGSHNEMSNDIIYDLLLAAEEAAEEEEEEEDKYINRKAEHGFFPLYIASRNGDNDIVGLLIDKDAAINEVTDEGTTPLMIAIQEHTNNSHLEVIQTLLEGGADLEIDDNTGHNALFYAQENGDAKVIELLMEHAPGSSSSRSSNISNRSRSYTPTPSPSPSPSPKSKSKSFSVGSVEPTELETISINKSQIPETAEDFVNLEDVNIADFLAESDKNRIIKAHNSFYALNGEDIKTHFLTGNQKNNYVYYPCKRALPPPALGVSKNDVHMDKPLFSASYLVGVLSDFVLLSEVMAMLESENKYFEIIISSEVQNVPATASAQMFTSNRNAVSANHCQEGKAAKILKLKMLDVLEVEKSSSEAEEVAEAKGTRRRHKKRESVKRRYIKKQSVKRRYIKKQSVKRRNHHKRMTSRSSRKPIKSKRQRIYY